MLHWQAVSVIFNTFNQGKTSVPTHYVDKEELEDQPAFSVKVVGHENFEICILMQIDCWVLYYF